MWRSERQSNYFVTVIVTLLTPYWPNQFVWYSIYLPVTIYTFATISMWCKMVTLAIMGDAIGYRHGSNLNNCIPTKSIHTIAGSIKSPFKFGSFTPNSSNPNIRPACPNPPYFGEKHCPACTEREGMVHWTLNNSTISSGVAHCPELPY